MVDLDDASYQFLRLLYELGEMTVEEANNVTGYPESVRNEVTSFLLSIHYIEYILGGYEQNADGVYVDVGSSFHITPLGRAYIQSKATAKNKAEQEAKNKKSKGKEILIKIIEIAVAPLIIAIISILIQQFCFNHANSGIPAPNETNYIANPENSIHSAPSYYH